MRRKSTIISPEDGLKFLIMHYHYVLLSSRTWAILLALSFFIFASYFAVVRVFCHQILSRIFVRYYARVRVILCIFVYLCVSLLLFAHYCANHLRASKPNIYISASIAVSSGFDFARQLARSTLIYSGIMQARISSSTHPVLSMTGRSAMRIWMQFIEGFSSFVCFKNTNTDA